MLPKPVLHTLIVLMLSLLGAVGYGSVQAEGPNAWATIEMNLRAGPGRQFDSLSIIAANTPLVLEARNRDTAWVIVHTLDSNARGWAKTTLLKISPAVSLYRLPISDGVISGAGGPPTAAPAIPTIVLDKALTAPALPQISARIRASVRAIAAVGRRLGNNPRVFSKVGDCMTDHWAFLNVFGYRSYDLRQYGYLQGVIDYFSIPPREGVADSFVAKSEAAHNGFNSAAVQDPTYADPNFCRPGESPLDCEYRLNKPGIAVIMFGTADVLVMTPQQFNYYLRGVIKKTMDRGIVPLLSTFPENQAVRDKARQINLVVLTIAREKNLPVMNLQAALESLPNSGIDGSNGIYLTLPPEGRSGFFTEENLKYGYTVRNLVTLQALDVVRQLIN